MRSRPHGRPCGAPDEACALLAAAGPYDLILCDAFRCDTFRGSDAALGGASAYDGLERVRRAAAAPIVIVSAWPTVDLADHLARGYATVLAKPFDLDDLTHIVRSLVPPPDAPDPSDPRVAGG